MERKRRLGSMIGKAALVMLAMLLTTCIDRLEFDVPSGKAQFTVEGMITDAPGNYLVKVSEGILLEADSVVRQAVKGLKITLFDDEGRSEDLIEREPGNYITGGLIQGKVGHSYHIRIVTPDGQIFESEPDRLNEVGEIESIRFQYEQRTVEKPYGFVEENVFLIYIDSKAPSGDNPYVRWKFTGTYKVLSYPERHWIWALGFPLPDPYPCSGIYYAGNGPDPIRLHECVCCVCYAHDHEAQPQLSDGQFVVGGSFKNIAVGTVPINPATFYEKYLVDIEQMSLSRTAFDFFKRVRDQKESAASLFQAPFGEAKSNIKALNSNAQVTGIFWATSISKKSIFINRKDVPYLIPEIAEIRYPCMWYPYATTDKPINWE